MNETLFLGLIHNVSLLLAAALLFDMVISGRQKMKARIWQVPFGLLLGGVGVALMLTPWVFVPGINFDTRSVLLSIVGLFFGAIPALIAIAITALFRFYQGGNGALTGVLVIVATGAIGLAWRRFRQPSLEKIDWRELYLFGLITNVVMLLLMFTLPWEIAWTVLTNISLPVLLIYPVGTMLLGLLMVNRLRRENIASDLVRSEARMHSLVNILQRPIESVQDFLDFSLEQAIRLTNSKIGYIYFYSEERQEFELNSWSKGVMDDCAVLNPQTCYELEKTGLWGEAVRQQKPIMLNHFEGHHSLKKGYPEGHVRLRKFLTVPIFSEGHIVAVVGVANKETDYEETDVLQLTLLMGGVWKVIEQKRAAAALSASEEQYRRIVDTAQEGIWIMDADQRTTFVNPHQAAMLGYTPDEMLGRPAEDFMFTEDLADHTLRMQERRQGENGQYERRFRMRDGREIWTIVSGTAFKDNEGQFSGFLGMFTNITQRKRMDDIMQARLYLLQFAVTHTLDELLQQSLDTIGELVTSPIGFYHLLAADQKTLLLQAWSTQTIELFCQADGKDMHYNTDEAGVWVDCVRERRPVIHNDYGALPHRKGMPAGHAEVFRELVVPIFRGSVIVGILGVGNKPTDYDENDVDLVSRLADLTWDIAEQKRAQEKLRLNSETAAAILNAATKSVFLMTIEGQIAAANETTAARLGKDGTDLVGVNMFDLLPPDVAESRRKQVNIVLNERKPAQFEDERFGSWIENNVYPIFDTDGQIRRVAIYGRDITERKQAEATIRQAQIELQRLFTESDQSRRALFSVVQDQKLAEDKIRQLNLELERRVQERTAQLEAANKELEAFAYSVSHDLRAPLRALDGFSGALLVDYQDQLDDQGKHYLERIQEATRRMGQLIEDLLNLSRITRREMTLEPVDLSLLAEQVVNELQAQAPERKIEFNITPGLWVRADSRLMKIAMVNLLNNAIKFTLNQPQAHIEVGMIEQSGEQVYFVRDNGAGFNMEYAHKLFSPFQRLHSAQEFPGTGIGLVTVQRIITRHGGRVWPEAAVGQGATFYFTLESQ